MMTFVRPTESATRAQRAFPNAHLLEVTVARHAAFRSMGGTDPT